MPLLARLALTLCLQGSNTAKTGLFMKTIPPEESSDFLKPKIEHDDSRPFWVIADSRGVLKGLLHVHRKSGYSKDIILLVSNHTSKDYLDYLKERNYDYIVAGTEHVDYRLALEELSKRYGIKTVITDTGGVLASILLERGFVDEVQLLISPEIVGKKAVNLFRSLNQPVKLQLTRNKIVGKNQALSIYKVQK